jgi:hypothetical protein
MRRLALLLIAPLVAFAGDLDLTETGWRSFKEKILPAREELAWQAIGWRTSFQRALAEAQEKDRPVLLWAMNGHPLGCT